MLAPSSMTFRKIFPLFPKRHVEHLHLLFGAALPIHPLVICPGGQKPLPDIRPYFILQSLAHNRSKNSSQAMPCRATKTWGLGLYTLK